jgi:hypothetical protein
MCAFAYLTLLTRGIMRASCSPQGVSVPSGLDARGLPLLTAALRAAGVSQTDVEALMGGTALRLLRATLPLEEDMAASAARGTASNRHSAAGADGIEFDIWM